MKQRRSKDLEFHVGDRIFKTFAEAAGHAVSVAVSHGGPVSIDVVAWTKSAARAWAGDYGVEEYLTDPEASVHERIVVRADSQGRIA